MSTTSSLVPARFLTIIAHFVIVITIFWSREYNVKASLPLDFTQDQYEYEDRKLVVGLGVTLCLFAIELAGFLSGVSMFNSTQGLLSTGVHASASVALLFFLFEQWESDIYWWILAICSASVSLSFFVFEKWECWTYWVIFAVCSVLPAFVEILVFISVLGLKKKPL